MVSDGAEYMTAQEAMARLAISRATFYNHARELERFHRVGDRRAFYRASDIEAMAGLQPKPREPGQAVPIVYPTRRRKRPQRQS